MYKVYYKLYYYILHLLHVIILMCSILMYIRHQGGVEVKGTTGDQIIWSKAVRTTLAVLTTLYFYITVLMSVQIFWGFKASCKCLCYCTSIVPTTWTCMGTNVFFLPNQAPRACGRLWNLKYASKNRLLSCLFVL